MSETLWDGGPILHQAPGVFPMGTDSILLADFARVGKRDRILDLGTGSGILPVLLLSMAPAATASAVELSPRPASWPIRIFSATAFLIAPGSFPGIFGNIGP